MQRAQSLQLLCTAFLPNAPILSDAWAAIHNSKGESLVPGRLCAAGETHSVDGHPSDDLAVGGPVNTRMCIAWDPGIYCGASC